MSEIIRLTESIITGEYLLDERWHGIRESEMASFIDAVYLEDFKEFPTPYYHHKTVEDAEGNCISFCQKCVSKDGYYKPPYDIKEDKDVVIYCFDNVVFKISEIVEFEKGKDILFCHLVDIHDHFSSLFHEPPKVFLTKSDSFKSSSLEENIQKSSARVEAAIQARKSA